MTEQDRHERNLKAMDELNDRMIEMAGKLGSQVLNQVMEYDGMDLHRITILMLLKAYIEMMADLLESKITDPMTLQAAKIMREAEL